MVNYKYINWVLTNQKLIFKSNIILNIFTNLNLDLSTIKYNVKRKKLNSSFGSLIQI